MLVRKLFIPLMLLAGVGVVASRSSSAARCRPASFPTRTRATRSSACSSPTARRCSAPRPSTTRSTDILAKQPGIRTYNGIAGFSFFTRTAASYLGTGFIGFMPWEERKAPELASNAIVGQPQREVRRHPRGAGLRRRPPCHPRHQLHGRLQHDAAGSRAAQSYEYLAQNVGQLHRRGAQAAGARRPAADLLAGGAPALRRRRQGQGDEGGRRRSATIYNALQTFLGGSYVNDFTRFGRQWRVFLQAEPAYRTKAEDVGQFYVRNGKGDMVPLSSFVSVRSTSGPGVHRALQPVPLRRDPGRATRRGTAPARRSTRSRTSPRRRCRPTWATRGTASPTRRRSRPAEPRGCSGLSLVFVFLILAALYESWSLAVQRPSEHAGRRARRVSAGLVSRHFDNNVYAQIGLVMLVGLTAKNAILIVEFAKERARGRASPSSTRRSKGRKLRLRPILMTSFAFIFGCIPLWIATGAGAAARRMLGTAVISGMLAATLLGVFFIPALFVAVERLSHRGATCEHPVPATGGDAVGAAHAE